MFTSRFFACMALAALVWTVYGSLVPLDFRPRPFDEAWAAFGRITTVGENDAGPGGRGDWVISIVTYAVLSYLLMAAWCVDQGRAVGLAAALVVVPFCVFLSVAVEFTQLYFPPRTVSIYDITLECVGGLLGPIVWLAVGQRVTDWARRVPKAVGLSGLAGIVLPGYLVVLLIVALLPFDLTLSWDELAGKFREGKVVLVPFTYWEGETADLLMKMLLNVVGFFPLGLLKALTAGRRSWASRPWTTVLLYGLAYTGTVELLQLFVYSRFCDTTDIVTGTAAVLLGWRVGIAARSRWASCRRSIVARGDDGPNRRAPS